MNIRPVVFLPWIVMGCGNAGTKSGGGLTLDPPKGYVGFDETVSYRLPIQISGGTGVKWSSSDVTTASVLGDDFVGVVSGNKQGTATITAAAGNLSGSSSVTVESFKAADREAGKAAAMSLGCAMSGCHDAAGPDISPSTCGKHKASELLDAIRKGINPEGGEISIGAAAHSFNAPDSIVAYVRSLEPYGIPINDN